MKFVCQHSSHMQKIQKKKIHEVNYINSNEIKLTAATEKKSIIIIRLFGSDDIICVKLRLETSTCMVDSFIDIENKIKKLFYSFLFHEFSFPFSVFGYF